MNKKTEVQLINEWLTKGTSYRKLASKYGCSLSHVGRMMKRQKRKQEEDQAIMVAAEVDDLPDDVKALKKALREERIKNELLNSVIEIASKELGVDIRKKSGTRQSL
jgi:Mor family transcriptional regulator